MFLESKVRDEREWWGEYSKKIVKNFLNMAKDILYTHRFKKLSESQTG